MNMLGDAVWLTGVIMFGAKAWDTWHGQSSDLRESVSLVSFLSTFCDVAPTYWESPFMGIMTLFNSNYLR